VFGSLRHEYVRCVAGEQRVRLVIHFCIGPGHVAVAVELLTGIFIDDDVGESNAGDIGGPELSNIAGRPAGARALASCVSTQ
jgi:hypothetical protein